MRAASSRLWGTQGWVQVPLCSLPWLRQLVQDDTGGSTQ